MKVLATLREMGFGYGQLGCWNGIRYGTGRTCCQGLLFITILMTGDRMGGMPLVSRGLANLVENAINFFQELEAGKELQGYSTPLLCLQVLVCRVFFASMQGREES
jgi:hypothetical protein